MAYGESNNHVLDDVTCLVFLFGTDYNHVTFAIDKIASKYRRTANIIEKTSVYHTVNGNCALFHTSKAEKMIKVILLSSTLTF